MPFLKVSHGILWEFLFLLKVNLPLLQKRLLQKYQSGAVDVKDYVAPVTKITDVKDKAVKEKGYESGTLNNDGSVTFVMSASQYEELLGGIKNTLDDALNDMVGSEEYPNVTAIKHSDDYTEFTITTKSEEIGLSEMMSVVTFYTLGYTYSVYCGEEIGNVHVDFINEASGEVIYSTDSDDWGEE